MMKKNHLKIIISPLFSLFFVVAAYSAFSPIQNFSGDDTCYYKVTGAKYNNVAVNSGWNTIACSSSLNFNSIPNGVGALEDGTYTIDIKSKDRTTQGDIKSYISEAASDAANKYGITTWGPYKIDTKAPTCLLKEIRFLADQSNNQYYNAGNFYYKSNGGSGQFELVIESDDTANGAEPNTSKLSKIEFPTILGYSPATISYSPSTGSKVTVTGKYTWSGNNTDSGDILNNASKKFCFDEAGNNSSLTTDANTKLVIQDGNQTVTGITTLILTPDNQAPTVGGVGYDALTNGIQYKTGNTGLGALSSIYSGNSNTIKVFAAFNSRQLQLPGFQDTGSGLKTFKVKIESYSDKNAFITYNKSLSTKDGKVNTLSDATINHDFSKVDLDYVANDGYRNYSWDINTLNLAGDSVETDKICDMVGNCIAISTPDFKVVANAPTIAGNTNLVSGLDGIKHNLDGDYSGDLVSMRSNMSDIHTTLVNFEDQYGNAIVPVSGIKEIKLHANFDNTLGCDQYGNPLAGDCVDFTFKNVSSALSGISNPLPGEKKDFNFTLNSYLQFVNGNLKIELTSAIPTKNEYTFSGTMVSLYGDLTAKLQLSVLTIKVDDKTGYNGVGENDSALELANSTSNKPNYKWSPLITFDYIDNIYPLVEGQEKELKISNKVTDDGQLDGYKLETRLGTNNFFLQFKDTSLINGNTSNGNEYYDILKNSGFSTTHGYGSIAYSGNDTLKFTPKTIGGISSSATNIALYTTLNYKVGTKIVKIPSLQTGFNDYGIHETADFTTPSEYNTISNITFAEIDVRGISQTGNDVFGTSTGTGATTTGNDTFKDFSSISLYDIKTNINQNVVKLLAGYDKDDGIVSGGATIGSFNFGGVSGGIKLQNNDVIYFKDTNVTLNCGLTCSISGKKTIIVENGNLFISSDMKYANTTSMLGIILIGNTYNGNTSQLRISENITNGVGIVYAEGPVLSVNTSNTKIYDGGNTGNTNLVNQLYWKGSFATRNTVGGSIKDVNGNGVCPYGTPDYQNSTCTLKKAQGYDLIYLRRYARVEQSYYGIASNPMGDGKVPLNIDKTSIKTAGGDTYAITTGNKTNGSLEEPTTNNLNAPLIIEYDANTQLIPPLGFTNN